MMSKKPRGFVLLFAISALFVLALIAGVYFKDSQLFQFTAVLENKKTLEQKAALAQVEYIRRSFIQGLDSAASATATNTMQMRTLVTNLINSIENRFSNPGGGTRVDIECKFQEAGGARDACGKDSYGKEQCCTIERSKTPKAFSLKYSFFDQTLRQVVTTDQIFQITPATATDFAYIIADSDKNIEFKNISFVGPVIVMFKTPPNPPGDFTSGNFMIFNGTSPGTIFDGVLKTNLSLETELVKGAGAGLQLSRLALREDKAQFSQSLTKGFNDAYEKALADASLNIKGQLDTLTASLETACGAVATGAGDSCIYSYSGEYVLGAGGAKCNLDVIQHGSWACCNGGLACGSTLACGAAAAGSAPPVSLIGGPKAQTTGKVYYLQGNSVFRANSSTDPIATLCARQTFLGDTIEIKQSIQKDTTRSNSAIFTKGNIIIPADVKLIDPANPSQAISLADVKATGTSLPVDKTTLLLEMSMIPQTGNFQIDESFWDTNDYPTRDPVTVGQLEIFGLLGTANPMTNSAVWYDAGIDKKFPAGFSNVIMRQDVETVTRPPDGLAFNIMGFKSSVVTMTTSRTDLNQAIQDLSR